MRVGAQLREVVVRAIGNDLHMDYSAWARPPTGSAHGAVGHARQHPAVGGDAAPGGGPGAGHALGPVPVQGLEEPVEAFELVGASDLLALAGRGRSGPHTLCRAPAVIAGVPHQALARAQCGSWPGGRPGGRRGAGAVAPSTSVVHTHRHPQGWRVSGERLGVLWQGHALLPRDRPVEALLPCR